MLELIPIGYTTKSRGVKGHIKLNVEDRYQDDVLKARALFINLAGSKVPFLIEQRELTNSLLVKLEEVDSPEHAHELLSKAIYLDAKEVTVAAHEDEETQSGLVDFEVFEQNDTRVGIVVDVIEYPSQILLQIDTGERTILLPLHEDLLLELDEAAKRIKLEVAEGLLDI